MLFDVDRWKKANGLKALYFGFFGGDGGCWSVMGWSSLERSRLMGIGCFSRYSHPIVNPKGTLGWPRTRPYSRTCTDPNETLLDGTLELSVDALDTESSLSIKVGGIESFELMLSTRCSGYG